MIVAVAVAVIAPVIVAVHLNGNDTVIVIDTVDDPVVHGSRSRPRWGSGSPATWARRTPTDPDVQNSRIRLFSEQVC